MGYRSVAMRYRVNDQHQRREQDGFNIAKLWVSLDLHLQCPPVVMFVLSLNPNALFFLSLFWFLLSPGEAGIVNRTIDDSFGDSQTGRFVTYLPSTAGVWEDETCTGCAIRPSVRQAFKNTYTAATYNPGLGNINITMQFNGTAIYVFFILANNAGDGITTLTLANFTLDGNAPQLFQHAPDLTTTAFDFNQLVFAQTNLINAQHTLVISTSGVNTNVFVNFDYAIYTHDDGASLLPLPAPGTSTPPTASSVSSSSTSSLSTAVGSISPTEVPSKTPKIKPTPSSSGTELGSTVKDQKSTPAGAIAGGVVGGLLALALLVFLLVFCLRRRKKRSRESMEARGYVPPLMAELSTPIGQPTNPFTTPPRSRHADTNNTQPRPVPASQIPMPSPGYASTSQANSESAYGGYVEPSHSGSVNDFAASNSGLAYLASNRPRLISVTPGDHLSSPRTDGPLSSSSILNSYSAQPGSTNIDEIRRARQNELDQRLRTVQEEMAFLASDITGEKSGRQSLRRQRTLNRGQGGHGSGAEGEGDGMTMEEMREQLRHMTDQIAYLKEQQRSAWAQGLSDDPPPGYTPESSTTRYSGPPQTPFN